MAARIKWRARDGEDKTSEIGGHARRDQRSGVMGGLNDDDSQRYSGDQSVATREIPCPRLPPECHLADRKPVAPGDLLHQRNFLRRIGLVQSARKDGNRPGFHASAVGGGIDSAGKRGRNRIAGAAQVTRDSTMPTEGRVAI